MRVSHNRYNSQQEPAKLRSRFHAVARIELISEETYYEVIVTALGYSFCDLSRLKLLPS
jgi:hypothetical protein